MICLALAATANAIAMVEHGSEAGAAFGKLFKSQSAIAKLVHIGKFTQTLQSTGAAAIQTVQIGP